MRGQGDLLHKLCIRLLSLSRPTAGFAQRDVSVSDAGGAETLQHFLQPQQMRRRLRKSGLMAGLAALPAAEKCVLVSSFQMWPRETVWCCNWKQSSVPEPKPLDMIHVWRLRSCLVLGLGWGLVRRGGKHKMPWL